MGIGAVGVLFGAWFMTKPPGYTPVPAPVIAPLPEGPIVEAESKVFAAYAGDAACQACHAQQHAAWSGSHHQLAERPFDPKLDDAAFTPERSFKHGSQTTTVKHDASGTPMMDALGFDGVQKAYPLARVIGHDPLRQFLTPGPNGRLHTMEATWDPKAKEWFNVYGNEDRKPGEWGHWTGRGMVWNTMCASCHNTRVRKNYDQGTDTFHTTMAHPTVSCEACHGPMKAHAQGAPSRAQEAAGTVPLQKGPWGGQPLNQASKASKQQALDACAMCHARRTELTGDFKPGDDFFDHHFLAIADHSDIFWPDGQIRDEDYEFAPFLASRMHHAGVSCTDCHDPHTAKTILPGNDLCMRCHTAGTFPNAPPIVPAAHTFHGEASTGSQCINCHMPQTVYMQRHSRHDHGFTIPDPLMTQQFGMPNACNKCHQDKDTDWSLAAVEKWYGPRMERRTRSRTTLLAKAKRGDTDAREGLIQFLRSDETPYWKASASSLIDQWLPDPGVEAALVDQFKHPHPLVRTAAIQALGPMCEDPQSTTRAAVQPLVRDPIRSVRVAAAWALRDQVDVTSVAGRELLHMLEINADQPSGQMQLAQFHYARQALPQAIGHMQRAVSWDAGSPPFFHDLAMMQSLGGDVQSSIQNLQSAIRLNPREAEYHYKLGLAWNEAGDMAKALAALREAVRVDPRHPRAGYNLGLALNGQGQPEEALQVLAAAAQAHPLDASIPYARATILARLGRKAEALADVQRALNAQPTMAEAIELRAMLSR
jgi:predicted CXXCH cytochrome family protein